MASDKVVSKQRGYYLYFTAPGGAGSVPGLCTFQGKLMAVASDQLAYFTHTGTAPNQTGSAGANTGETVAVTGGRKPRTMLAGGNLFFTTDNGVMKAESYNGAVQKAGIPPALDVRGDFIADNGPVNGEAQVGWRVAFGRRPSTGRILLGAPSDILVLTNSKVVGAAWTRTSNVVTVTSALHGLATGMAVVTSNSLGGSPQVTDGSHTITVVNSSTFTFSSTGSDDASGNTLDYTATRAPRFEISIPSEITDGLGFFAQIYRTTQSADSDTVPFADFAIIDEVPITAAMIAARFFVYDDTKDDILRGAELYTNPNTREGELQANDRPPLPNDITYYKSFAIYGGITERQYLDLQVIDTALSGGAYVEIKIDATTRRYVSDTSTGNTTVFDAVASGTGTITITADHGLSTGDYVYIFDITGTVVQGRYPATVLSGTQFTIAGGTGLTATKLSYYQELDSGGFPVFFRQTSGTAATKLRETAQALVKAINRDSSSLVYARYVSAVAGDTPGKIRLLAKGFTGTIYARANTTANGEGFLPTLPDSFSTGTQVQSLGDSQLHTYAVAKPDEEEAVPFDNREPVGSRNGEILRVLALEDAFILLKDDGVYRVTGDTIDSFVMTPVDQTVICVAADSARVVNNEAYFLSNKGVIKVGASGGCLIVSRGIQDDIQPIVAFSDIADITSSAASETDFLYYLSTAAPNQDEAFVTHILNVLTGGWTTSTRLFSTAAVGPDDELYVVDPTGETIYRERKGYTKIDYCGQSYDATVTAVAANLLSATVTTAAVIPRPGWAFVKDDTFSRITAVSGTGPFVLTFQVETNLEAGDTTGDIVLYAGYRSRIKLAPVHGGAPGRMKQWGECTAQLRNSAASRLDVWFASQYFESSKFTHWGAGALPSGGGYGSGSFGYTRWGDVDSINLDIGTQPSTPARVLVPLEAQRSPWIQPAIEHEQAGEPINLQSILLAARVYGQRIAT